MSRNDFQNVIWKEVLIPFSTSMLAFWKQLHLERICFKQTIKTFLEYLLPEDDEGDDDHDDPDNSSANLQIS